MTVHPIPPVWDTACCVLILGSFPSVRSRESGFFYGHPQNRFWRVLAALYGVPPPLSIEEKKTFLLTRHIALWDVIASCEIIGSADSSIRKVIPNDILPILASAPILHIFTNGNTASALYRRYLLPKTNLPCRPLPSTSAANASWTMPRLCEAWSAVRAAADENGDTL